MEKENPIPLTKMPDRFVLEKDQIKFILSSVEKHWQRDDMNAIQNAGYVSIMATIKGLLQTPLVSLVTLKNVYFSVQEAAGQLATLNQLMLSVIDAEEDLEDAKEDEESTQKEILQKERILKQFKHLVEIQIEKIGSGKAFEG